MIVGGPTTETVVSRFERRVGSGVHSDGVRVGSLVVERGRIARMDAVNH
jgi:hypothetical protein